MRIGLMSPSFVDDDEPIANDIFGIFSLLQSRGMNPIVFTSSGEARLPVSVLHYADLPMTLDNKDDVLIYFFCGDDPTASKILRQVNCRVIVKYHSVVPSNLWRGHSVDKERLAKRAGEAAFALGDQNVEGFMCGSEFNGRELRRFGIHKKRIVIAPPLHRIPQLQGMDDNAYIVSMLGASAFNILAVGSVTPDSGLDLIVESFARTIRSTNVGAHLHIVGAHHAEFQNYINQVGGIVSHNGVGHRVTLYGAIDPLTLGTFYRHCDVFLCASQHDGSCLNVITAMAFGLPIVATTSGALPEICGDAALFGEGVDEFVSRLSSLLSDDQGRMTLARRAAKRYDDCFRLGVVRQRFLNALDDSLRQAGDDDGGIGEEAMGGDWFGLPQAERLILPALALAPPMVVGGLRGRDPRMDFVNWTLRDAWRLSDEVAVYLRSSEFKDYASTIEMPTGADHFDPKMRLAWRFHRFANSRFDLRSPADVAAFVRWYRRDATDLYAFAM